MRNPNETPTFNLKVVVRETGLKPDTLRAWERRYGMPQPERTAGHHRLYSQRDIDILKWLVARQDEGLSISRAVELWRRFEAEGQDPLLAMTAVQPSPTEAITSAPGGDVLKNLRQAWISAGMLFDEARAEQMLSQAFAMYPVEAVCFDVLQKGLAEVGEGWYRGETTVQQEHFISELAMRRLETLLATTPPPTRPGRIVTGCPPEEEHIFSPLLLTLLLRRRGWNVLYLGANVPTLRIEATINSTKPHLVIMAAQHLPTAATLLDMSQVFQKARVPLAFGGLIFNRVPDLRFRIPGHFLGEQLPQVPAQIEQWLTASRPLSPVVEAKPVEGSYPPALAHYQLQRGLVEAKVWEELRNSNGLLDFLPYANGYLAKYIVAGLRLGDMNYLNEDLAWLEQLIRHYALPEELLSRYLRVYHQAIKTHLDERGEIITTWLAQFVKNNNY
ncbi:MAG: MerR family transcriptional regulator [Anaerolineae bacterium]|nr:MerR family transcriptional regulator [Anaerolineae bacterium]